MLSLLQGLGALLLIAAPFAIAGFIINFGLQRPSSGLGKWVYRWWPFGMPNSVKARLDREEKEGVAELRDVTAVKPKDEMLVIAPLRSVLKLMGKRTSIRGRLALLSLQFFGSNKRDKVHLDPDTDRPLPEYPWITLDSGDVITLLPNKESGNQQWFYAAEVTDRANAPAKEYLREFGKRFADSNQTAEVTFSYPGLGDHRWRCTDIVWADCQTEGRNRFGSATGTMTRVSMLLAKDDQTEEFLLYVMIRGGIGTDGLYILREFNPEVEVEEIL